MVETVRFAHIDALYLLLLLVPMWLARRKYLKYLRESQHKLDAPIDRIESSTRRLRWPLIRARAAAVCLSAAALGLMLALARPQVFTTDREDIVRQLDVVFLLDTSPSMGAEDVVPSRLERATQVIRDIVVGEPLIQRVGLVTFTRSSLILSYLTSDVQNVLFYLDYLRQQSSSGIGTNIGAAVGSGIQVVQLSREKGTPSNNRPIMILLSDGEDHEAQLESALRQATAAGLTVYTIGIASEAGGFIPRRDEQGKVTFVQDLQGVRLISRLDEGSLRRVAEVTGGRFYRAREGQQVLTALREIVSRERQVVGVREEKNWVDIYHPILVTAAFLALLGWTLGRG